MADQPAKADIQTIFKRLRSAPTNKQCFDCGSSNPTWASITYGVFLCIDCSAVHRSLGVHVTFIRSTQLDTSWTWLQLRAMQVGGNANATAFFRQHGCTTSDAQQKYHSRAASMYREKLHHLATQAMRLHGSKLFFTGIPGHKLHIDHHEPLSPEQKEVDFFHEHTNSEDRTVVPQATNGITDSARLYSEPQPIKSSNTKKEEEIDPSEGPSVEHALSMSPTQAIAQAEPRKVIIGAKKTAGGKKKGFGAQKVTANFNDIENRAQQIDKEREELAANQAIQEARTKEEQEKQMASMRLAYQDMNVQRKKQEDKLKATDPKKAEQFERLGMGFAGAKGISHSAVTDMQTIEQEAPSRSKSSFDRYSDKSSRTKDFFDDEFDLMSSRSSRKNNFDKWGDDNSDSWGTKNKSGSWDIDRFEAKTSFSETISPKEEERPSRNRKAFDTGPPTEEAQKKFGNAKSISSDQFHGNKDPDYEMKANLARYEGSSSISSSDLFGGDSSRKSQSSSFSGPDLQDIKDGVKQGVTKVAGKLSTLANGVMSSLQDKYGS